MPEVKASTSTKEDHGISRRSIGPVESYADVQSPSKRPRFDPHVRVILKAQFINHVNYVSYSSITSY